MKFRYLAIAGPSAARAALIERSGLGRRALGPIEHRAKGKYFEIWAARETPILSGDGGGSCLIGFAYDRTSGEALTFAPATTKSAEDVVRTVWGCYAWFADQPGGHRALRDPSGAVPVYMRNQDGCEIYASDEDLLALGASRKPIADLEFIRHWLSFPFLRAARTGCVGVRELVPGRTRACEAAMTSERQAWTPGEFVVAPILDFAEAAERLREEMLRTIPQVVARAKRPVLKLSGGLDSSIVAMALSAAGQRFTAVNFATKGPEGDERRFARQVADACRVELLEMCEAPCRVDLHAAKRHRLRPPRHPLLDCLDQRYAAQWRELDADAVIDGAGGDNVFAYLTTAAPVLDAWACGGLAASLRTIADLAAVHGVTFWNVAGFAWRKRWRSAGPGWPTNREFLTASAAPPQPEAHPWLDGLARGRPGIREHVRSIVGAYHFLGDQGPEAPVMLRPLLAQPIVELCLRIPTHLWFHGGRDRAAARAAFASLLPDVVSRRRQKSALGGMFRAQFRALLPELGEYLLRGRLVEAGIVDRRAVADYLENPDLETPHRRPRLLEITAAEQWLRSFD